MQNTICLKHRGNDAFLFQSAGISFSQWLDVLVRNIVLWKIDTLFYFFGSSDGVHFKSLYRTCITR